MARTDNLKVFLTDVADAIRTKKGTTELIPANTFDTEIESISGGKEEQSKSVTITKNGTQTVIPDENKCFQSLNFPIIFQILLRNHSVSYQIIIIKNPFFLIIQF